MEKLQLYITKSYDGFSHMTDFNSDDQVKAQVIDITDAVRGIAYNPEDKSIFYMLRSTDSGVFITLIRTIPTDIGDHLAAWLYIPSAASITSYDIEECINTIVEIISNSKITSDALNTMRRILAKEYDTLQSPGQTVANMGSAYAHRFYGTGTSYTLSDFIGTKRYQTSYLPYAGVILADKSKAEAIDGPDITVEPLEQMVRIFPPRASVSAYRPTIYGRPFTKPFLVPLMGTIEIVWKSPTGPDVHQSIKVSQPNMRPEPVTQGPDSAPEHTLPAAPPAKPALPTPSAVTFTTPAKPNAPASDKSPATQSQTPVTTPTPTPKPAIAEQTPAPKAPQTPPAAPTAKPASAPASTPVSKPDTVPAAAPAIKPTTAPATKPAPQPVASKPAAPRPTAQQPKAQATPRKHSYVFKVASKSSAVKGMIEFTVTTDAILADCPLEGYECTEPIKEGEDKNNHLVYTPAADRNTLIKYGIIGLLAGILLTLLCVWIFSGKSGSGSKSTEAVPADTVAAVTDSVATQQTAPQTAAETAVTTTAAAESGKTLQDAIKYLDSREVWTKTEMESYPDLKGLYDDMNNFSHAKLYGQWATKLKGSKNYARVSKHAKLGKKKKPVITNGNGRTTFNAPGEESIKVQTFLNAIDH